MGLGVVVGSGVGLGAGFGLGYPNPNPNPNPNQVLIEGGAPEGYVEVDEISPAGWCCPR